MIRVLVAFGFPALVVGFVIFVLVERAGAVSRFVRARAFSPDTARRPASVGVNHAESLHHPVKRGMLVRTGDGLYYVSVPKLLAARRTRKRLLSAGAIIVVGAIAALMFAGTG